MEKGAIDKAREALGEGRSDDYVLSPTRHADELEAPAPALAALLRHASIETHARQYERLDAEALNHQRAFKRAAQHANAAVLAATAASALIMAMAILSEGGVRSALLVVLGLLGLAAGAYAAFHLYKIRVGALLKKWMSSRAEAETTRLAYFQAVVDRNADRPSGIPLELLKLEYFRRYQLDVQVAYYGTRRRDHETSGNRSLTIGAVAAAVAAFGAGVAGVWGAYLPSAAALALLGTVGAGLGAFAWNNEEINQDRRNAERYHRTERKLEHLRSRLDEVRSAVLAGNTQALRDFVEAVHDELSLEHRQWLESAPGANAAVDRLERTLAETRVK